MGDLVDRPGGQVPASQYSDYADDEIDLRELFGVLWDGKWWIAGITAVAAVIAVVYALSLPNIYRSEALLAPASAEGGGLGGLASKYGGIASLAGISLPSGGTDKTELGLQVMKSRVFVRDFIERRGILVPLMASQSWNPATGELLLDSEVYNSATQTWLSDVSPTGGREPSSQQSYKKFTNLLGVSRDKSSGFVTISVNHVSPIVAQQWVGWLVEDINETMRSQDVSEAERSIAYLKEQVTATSLTDLQAMFFELIQSQTETVMLAKVRTEYLFKTIDPAVVAEEKAEPQRSLICILGTMIGGVLALVFVLIRHYVFSSKEH